MHETLDEWTVAVHHRREFDARPSEEAVAP